MALNLFKKFTTDEAAEVNGVEVPYGTATLLIARIGNAKYAKKITTLVERNKMLLDAKDDAADELSQALVIEALAETVLVGWSGLTDENDLPMDYSVANAKRLLAMKDFRKEIMKMADDMEAYKVKAEAAAGKP